MGDIWELQLKSISSCRQKIDEVTLPKQIKMTTRNCDMLMLQDTGERFCSILFWSMLSTTENPSSTFSLSAE